MALVPLGLALCRALGLHADIEVASAQVLRWVLGRLPGIPSALVFEWLLPFALVSIGSLIAIGRWTARRMAVATWIGVAAYTVVSGIALGGEILERGAYLLPLVGPAALACARAFSRRTAWLLVASGAAASVLQVLEHDRARADYPVFLNGARVAADGRAAVVLVAHRTERAACATHPGTIDSLDISHWVYQPPERLRLALSILPKSLEAYAAGRQILVSDATLTALEHAGDGGRRIAADLRAGFAVHRVEAVGFRGSRLTRRQ